MTDIVKGLPIGEMSELAGLADTGDDNGEDTGAAFVADETEFNIFNTDRKLAAIEQAARMLAALPEKKALIYFAGGVSKTGVDNQAQLEASINAAVKANVAIYPIDTRGLMADPPGGGASKGHRAARASSTARVYNSQRASINDSQETLVTLAADTGGKAFLDSNDIAPASRRRSRNCAATTSSATTARNTAEDGKYRKITVKLNNKLVGEAGAPPGLLRAKVWGKLNGSG